MKKIVLVALLIVFFIPCAFSASNWATDLDSDLSSSLEIIFNPSSIEIMEFGFSRNKVTNTYEEIELIENGSVEDLVFNDDNSAQEGRVYLYWLILSPRTISASLSLSMTSPLKGKNGEIDWNVNLADDERSILSSRNIGSDLQITLTSDTFGSIGSVGLDITTENLNQGEIVSGEYTGELRLDISIE